MNRQLTFARVGSMMRLVDSAERPNQREVRYIAEICQTVS